MVLHPNVLHHNVLHRNVLPHTVLPHAVLPHTLPARPQRPAEPPTPVLRHGSPPAQRVLPLRRAA